MTQIRIVFDTIDKRSGERKSITVLQSIFKDVNHGAFVGQMLINHYEQLKEKGYDVKLTSFEVENV